MRIPGKTFVLTRSSLPVAQHTSSYPNTSAPPSITLSRNTGRSMLMAKPGNVSEMESRDLAMAMAYLAERGIAAGAHEFRLRQEFFRYGWDIRVREEDGGWTIHALKSDRPEVLIHASTEGDALRVALAKALQADEAASH
jgi:hypothetical protein